MLKLSELLGFEKKLSKRNYTFNDYFWSLRKLYIFEELEDNVGGGPQNLEHLRKGHTTLKDITTYDSRIIIKFSGSLIKNPVINTVSFYILRM